MVGFMTAVNGASQSWSLYLARVTEMLPIYLRKGKTAFPCWIISRQWPWQQLRLIIPRLNPSDSHGLQHGFSLSGVCVSMKRYHWKYCWLIWILTCHFPAIWIVLHCCHACQNNRNRFIYIRFVRFAEVIWQKQLVCQRHRSRIHVA